MSANPTETVSIHCPYCGEPETVVIDCSQGSHSYVEDCEVCCRPMELTVRLDAAGWPQVSVARDDEA